MLKYPNDRYGGFVALSCDGKHFIFGARLTPRGRVSMRDGRQVKRLLRRLGASEHLDRRNPQTWWYVGRTPC